MNTNIIIIILLAVIAYILWRIFRQKEDEKKEIYNEKLNAIYEQEQKERFKNYPHLVGNISDSWLAVFGEVYVEKKIPHMKAAFMIYLKESNNTKLDMMEVDMMFSSLWDITEELLEHLEKYHESTKYEYEIAILTYWQIIGEETESFIGKDLESIKELFQKPPFTDIQKIPSWFPKKNNHPGKEIIFTDKNGSFTRKAGGPGYIQRKIKALKG